MSNNLFEIPSLRRDQSENNDRNRNIVRDLRLHQVHPQPLVRELSSLNVINERQIQPPNVCEKGSIQLKTDLFFLFILSYTQIYFSRTLTIFSELQDPPL